MAKRVFFSLAAVCILIIAFIIFMPDTRQSLFGARLAHNLQVGRADGIVTVAQLLRGSEIRPVSVDGNVLPDPSVNTENYDVRIGAKESVQSVGGEDVVLYNIDSVESQQIGNRGAADLIGNAYRLRLNPLGLPIELKCTEGKASKAVDEICLTQMMAAWWPGLPSKRVRKGDSWNARWNVPFVVSVLDGKQINLCHNIKYCLEDIKADKGLNIANVTYKGDVTPNDLGELPENVEIAGTGMISGTAYINVTTGQTLVADERLIWSVAVRLRDQDMEVVQFADRNSRTYRPRYLPQGDSGFKPNDGDKSDIGLPTAGNLMQDKKGAANEKPAAAPTNAK